jgi:zinc transport system permease protein
MKITPTPTTTRMRGIAMDELVLRALVGALLMATMLGPLGAFVVWRRMAYFGDTIAHSALLGVAVSLLVGGALPMVGGIFIVAMMVALILSRYAKDARFHHDTLLGILAHGALALGLVLVSLNHSVQVDINAYLFGDVLAMDWADTGMLAALALVVLIIIRWQWRALLMTTIDPAIAKVEGVNVARTQLILTLVLAGVIALAIKLTGILLITALLVIPAAATRSVARSPAQMAVFASVLGMLSVTGGLFAALTIDVPTAPMMVVVASTVFVLSSLIHKKPAR